MHGFKVLTEQDVEAIHIASLRILAETGITLTNPEALEILAGAGAIVANNQVLLPSWLVEQEIAKATTKVSIRGRNGSVKVLGDQTLHWHNLGGAHDIYDARSNTRRKAMLKDLQDCTRLLDALEGVTTITPFFTPSGCSWSLDVFGNVSLCHSQYHQTTPGTWYTICSGS